MRPGWTSVTIKNLASEMFDGPFGSALKTSDYTDHGVRVARLENIGHLNFRGGLESFVSVSKAESLARHTLRRGDVLFSSFVDRETRVCVLPDELDGRIINKADCFCIRVEPKVCDARFVAYRLAAPSAYETFSDAVRGITRPRIGLRDLAGFIVDLPPLAEQRRIVEKLDALTARLARARAQLGHVEALAARLRSNASSSAFVGELTRGDRKGYDHEWTLSPIGAVAQVVTGSTPPSIDKDRLFGGDVAFFKPTDLDAGYHVERPRETLSTAGAARSRVVPAGTTLVTCIGATIGKTGFARVP